MSKAPPPKNVPVPDVVGIAYGEASARLTAAGFTVVRVDAVSTRTVGTVTATNPEPGTPLAAGARVTVTVAKPDLSRTTMPDVRGKRPRDAIAAVEAAGLVLDPEWRAAYLKPVLDSCRFRYSTPAAGTVLAKGTQVSLQYGCG